MHYNAELAPTLTLGAMIGWLRLQSFARRYYKNISKIELNRAAAVAIAILLFINIYGYKSPALLFTNPAFYAHTQSSKFLDRLIAAIPKTGTVMAQHNVAARLAYRKVYILRNNYESFEPDFIVFDNRAGQEPNNFLGVSRWDDLVNDVTNDPLYELYYDQGEQFIYKKKSFVP